MVSVNRSPALEKRGIPIRLSKLLAFILPRKEKYINEKILYYLRIYTGVLQAEDNLSAHRYGKSANLLRVVRNSTRNPAFREESVFLQRIHSIADEMVEWLKKVERMNRKLEITDIYTYITKLQMAQNICILRILERKEK